jgi:hypothetical protein
MATQEKTEQELKDILVTLGMEAGWHEVTFVEREIKGLDGLQTLINPHEEFLNPHEEFLNPHEEFQGDDWYGDYEYDLNFWCYQAYSDETYDSDSYHEPTISMYPVIHLGGDDYQTDATEELVSVSFREFLELANQRLASIY